MLDALVFSAGLGFHAENYDKPEVQGMDNPIGIVRISNKWDNGLEAYCEHISSIPVWEYGLGFNHCGILLEFK